MPWEIAKKGNQFCVMKSGDKPETVTCHPTRDKALAHMRALYKNAGPEAKPSAKAWEEQMAAVVDTARRSS